MECNLYRDSSSTGAMHPLILEGVPWSSFHLLAPLSPFQCPRHLAPGSPSLTRSFAGSFLSVQIVCVMHCRLTAGSKVSELPNCTCPPDAESLRRHPSTRHPLRLTVTAAPIVHRMYSSTVYVCPPRHSSLAQAHSTLNVDHRRRRLPRMSSMSRRGVVRSRVHRGLTRWLLVMQHLLLMMLLRFGVVAPPAASAALRGGRRESVRRSGRIGGAGRGLASQTQPQKR